MCEPGGSSATATLGGGRGRVVHSVVGPFSTPGLTNGTALQSYARDVTRRPDLVWRDAALPALLAVLGVVEMASLDLPGWTYGALLEVLACGLLVGRRWQPLVLPTLAGLILLAIPLVGPALDEPSLPIPMWLLALFALARWNPDLRGLVGACLIWVAILLDIWLVDPGEQGWPDVVFVTALMAPPFVLGRLLRQLTEQKALLERTQALIRGEAVRDERDRIARDLHDVIAHSVSAMVVQTAAAQDLVRVDPGRAEAALAEVAATGRRALSETGRLLHMIRDETDELGLDPAPGLADVTALVERFRANGLVVDLEVDQSPPNLPAGVDVSAYRIVQEVLTNALRYSADRTAVLRLAGTATGLTIRASNPAGGAPCSGSGLGLLGIAERVSLLGGSLAHGVTADGRFELAAELPATR